MNSVSTLNPGLATDITNAVRKANKRFYPNSGQVGTLSTLAMLQMTHAARHEPWVVTKAMLGEATGLSPSTITSHCRFWAKAGAITAVRYGALDGYIVTLEG